MDSDSQTALVLDNINPSNASIWPPAGGIVCTLAEDLAKLRLWTYVGEADVDAVEVEQNATFIGSAYLERKLPATIIRVAFSPTVTDNVVT